MLRLALGGTVAFAAILTVAAWAQTTSTAQSTGSPATTSTTAAKPAASLPGINAPTHGTFLGTPGSDAIQPATPGTTFLGALPAQSGPAIAGATTSSPTTNVNGTTGTTTTGANATTSTTLGDIALEAAVPVTVYYPATTMAQPQVVGTPVMLAQPTSGVAYEMVPTAGGQYIAMPVAGNQRPVGTAGTLPPGATRAAAAPVPSVARVADSDLLRAAQSRLRGVAGFADGRVSVEVQRGIIMVRTRNLSRAERDRVFTSVREVRGAIGVIVK